MPNEIGTSKNAPEYRYIAIRDLLRQGVLPGAELIKWHYARCGKSEQAHAIMKNDLAGGILPLNLIQGSERTRHGGR